MMPKSQMYGGKIAARGFDILLIDPKKMVGSKSSPMESSSVVMAGRFPTLKCRNLLPQKDGKATLLRGSGQAELQL